MKKLFKKYKRAKVFGIFLCVLLLGSGVAYITCSDISKTADVVYKTPEEKDPSVRFLMESFDTIQKNYWAKMSDDDLALHFQLSLQKAENNPVVPTLVTKDRNGVAKMLAEAFMIASSTESRKALALNTLNVALYNLQPFGRNSLLSQTQETTFREQVANVDSNKDLYKDLDLPAGSSAEAVAVAYEKKVETLVTDSSPSAKAELVKVSHAKDVLTNPNTKDLYDSAKIEPTASTNIMGKTLYIKIDRIAPTTLLEFGRTVYAATSTPGLNSMIIDLRQNIGGSLDFAQNFLGLFIGQNQFAFDLFHQNEYNVQRTVQPIFPELARYKEIVVLTDSMTQSTAEVTAAAFKRFKLGTVVGETTRGWGTVENTFALDTVIDQKDKYLLLLVHSVTLRDDNQPIETRGVDPDISIKDPNWKKNLETRLRSLDFAKVVEKVILKSPIK